MSGILLNTTTTTIAPSVSPNNSLVTSGVADKATRATFLALFIIGGFVGNSVLIATIAQSSRLKSSTINLCILSLAVANILDSAANMPLILGATITETWDYGTFVCRLNAFGIQLISIVVMMGLLVLTLDRCLAVRDPDEHHTKRSRRKMSIVIGLTWLHAMAFSIPLMLDSVVPIKIYPVRYLCTISANTPLVYLCLTSIFAYLIPIVICIGFFIYILQRSIKQKRTDKKRRSEVGFVEGSMLPSHKIWAEMEGAKYVGVLFSLWCVLQAPYLVLSSIMWYKNSTELAGWKAISDFLHFEYPWELELALTWLKLSYPVFVPSVTFLWKKEVWQKFKNTVLCRKSNLVLDASPRSSPEHNSGINGNLSPSTGVPVLFATENGLHFQTYNEEDECSDDMDHGTDIRDTTNTQIVTTKKCDVYGSQDFLQLDEDTSDYDSSGDIDPFSNSNPISVRTEYGRQKSQNSSSNSRVSTYQANLADAQPETVPNPPELVSIKSEQQASEHRTHAVKDQSRKHNRHNYNSSSSSLKERLGGEANPSYVIEEESVGIEEAEHEVEPANMERTSHDSGMGSLEKYKKVTRKIKVKTPPIEQSDSSSVADDLKSDSECLKTRAAPDAKPSLETEPHTATTAGKKKRKPRIISQSETETNNPVDKAKDSESPRALPDTEPSLTKQTIKPKPPPRKSKEVARDQTLSETITGESPAVGSIVATSTNSEPEIKPKAAERKSKSKNRDPVHSKSREQETSLTETQTESATQCNTEPKSGEESVEKPKKKKKKKKVLDPELRRKKMFQELDEGVQGVLY